MTRARSNGILSLGLATVAMFVLVGVPDAVAQCSSGARNFATIGGQDLRKMRVYPAASHAAGLEYGRFWVCEDSLEGNNFVPGDPQKKMAPAGTGGCASTDAPQAGGGWWQLAFTTMRGVDGLIAATGCVASSCPEPDDELCTVVEDWGHEGPPGTEDTAYFAGWRTGATPPGFRYWDLSTWCGDDHCTRRMQEFPIPLVASGAAPGAFTVRSNGDPAASAYVATPQVGPASELIESYDVMVHYGPMDAGRDRNALCDGSPCWELLAQVPYGDAELPPTEVAVDCERSLNAYVALALTFVGGGLGGPVPSQLVGRSVQIDCFCDDTDGDGAGCGDCDDGDPLDFPGALEVCDGRDNDCDGLVDEADPSLFGPWYRDVDGDGFGDPDNFLDACSPPAGYIADSSDCDDRSLASAFTFPGAAPNELDPGLCRKDRDEDDYGADSPNTFGVPPGTDCDDVDAAVNPGAEELCNGVDDDCNGLVDDDAGCALPSAVASTTLLSECASPAGATILLDGSGSSSAGHEIVLYEWFEDFEQANQTFLGSGETLEVTLPLGVHRIALRVTDDIGRTDTDRTVARYRLYCLEGVDPVEISPE